jgi:hypothetical protein
MLSAGLMLADQPQDSKQQPDTAQTSTRSRPRIRFGGLTVNARYSYYSGPVYYPYGYYPYYGWGPWGPWAPWGWGWYGAAAYSPFYWDPFYWGPSLHPGFFNGFPYGPAMGEVKLRASDKEAWVYLDGALAGKADKLKNMWLEPGAYNLEVRSGPKTFSKRIYVLSGKTFKLSADTERGEVRP